MKQHISKQRAGYKRMGIKINNNLMSAISAKNHCYLIPEDTSLECILIFPF
jgi:hypothetical protein